LSNLIKHNQNIIFNFKIKDNKSELIKKNLEYFYLLRNIDYNEFKKLIVALELKYKQFQNLEDISKNNSILIDVYYY
jgi:hypothetical protein